MARKIIPGSRDFVAEGYRARIDQEAARRKAASAMLAALERAHKAIPLTGHAGTLKAITAAIAAAKAAGIK